MGRMGPSKYHPLEAELVCMRELEIMVNEHVAEVNEILGGGGEADWFIWTCVAMYIENKFNCMTSMFHM